MARLPFLLGLNPLDAWELCSEAGLVSDAGVGGAAGTMGRMCHAVSGDRPVKDRAAQDVWRCLSSTGVHITSQRPGSLWTVSLNATSLPVMEQCFSSKGLLGHVQQSGE